MEFGSLWLSNAKVATDATSTEMCILWVKVLDELLPECTYAFPNYDGSQLQHFGCKIQQTRAMNLKQIMPYAWLKSLKGQEKLDPFSNHLMTVNAKHLTQTIVED